MPEDGRTNPPETNKCDQSLLPLVTRRRVPLGASAPLLSLSCPVVSITQIGTLVLLFGIGYQLFQPQIRKKLATRGCGFRLDRKTSADAETPRFLSDIGRLSLLQAHFFDG